MIWLLAALAFFQADPADAWSTCLTGRVQQLAPGRANPDDVAEQAMRHCAAQGMAVQRSIEQEAGGSSPEVDQELRKLAAEIRQEMRNLTVQLRADSAAAPASQSRTSPPRAPARRVPAQSRALACPQKLGVAQVLVCQCTSQATAIGSVWGSNIYTDDSSICRAALHAGMIGTGGGMVSVREAPGQTSYPSAIRNSVQSGRWPAWGRSIAFRSTGAAGTPSSAAPRPSGPACPTNARNIRGSLSCSCSGQSVSSGPVWGSGPYTADSRICRAARHAGVTGANGGSVTVRIVPGLSAYSGSTRNGVNSSGWGSYGTAFTFAR